MSRNGTGTLHPLWSRLHQFQNEMNRLFSAYDAGQEPAAFPPMNAWEDGDRVVVEVEVPGLTLNDLELFVTGGNQVTLKGTRKAPAVEKGVWHRQERPAGTFTRTLTLPFPVDADNVEAALADGVLTLRLTKHASALPRKIAVKGA